MLGREIGGYRIEATVGRGGMGVVYRAEHRHLQRRAAIKVLAPELAVGDFRDRFLRESRTAAAIHHPNIVTVFDAGEIDGLLYIAMQFIDGEDLGKRLGRGGRLDLSTTLAIATQVAAALDAAHAHGLVHRDVKPANVLMEGERAYLADFGLTRRISSTTRLTTAGELVGTMDYMAPEQIEGGGIDGRTDVYAFGCLLYHCMTGAAPYTVEEADAAVLFAHVHKPPPLLSVAQPELPRTLDAVVATAMAKAPDERYATCGEVMAAIAAVGIEEQADARSVERPKILVADQDPATRTMVRVALANSGLTVLEAGDAGSLSALARDHRPALLFIGAELLGRSAPGLAEALRSDGEAAGTKVVLLHRRGAAVAESDALDAVDDELATPFSPLQLLIKVRNLLGPEAIDW